MYTCKWIHIYTHAHIYIYTWAQRLAFKQYSHATLPDHGCCYFGRPWYFAYFFVCLVWYRSQRRGSFGWGCMSIAVCCSALQCVAVCCNVSLIGVSRCVVSVQGVVWVWVYIYVSRYIRIYMDSPLSLRRFLSLPRFSLILSLSHSLPPSLPPSLPLSLSPSFPFSLFFVLPLSLAYSFSLSPFSPILCSPSLFASLLPSLSLSHHRMGPNKIWRIYLFVRAIHKTGTPPPFIWMIHVVHGFANESCQTWMAHGAYDRVMTHVNEWCHV